MKTCKTCKENKSVSDFATNNTKPDGLNWQCRTCQSAYFKEYYKNNKKKHVSRVRVVNERTRQKLHEFLAAYFENNPCVECGEDNILVLEIDHINNKSKNGKAFSMGEARRNGISLRKVKKELERCQVLCANCHRVKTAHESNSWRLKFTRV